jgi:hypothetical protein
MGDVSRETPLRAMGVGRVENEPVAVVVYFNRRVTDNEMRAIHDLLRDARVLTTPVQGRA